MAIASGWSRTMAMGLLTVPTTASTRPTGSFRFVTTSAPPPRVSSTTVMTSTSPSRTLSLPSRPTSPPTPLSSRARLGGPRGRGALRGLCGLPDRLCGAGCRPLVPGGPRSRGGPPPPLLSFLLGSRLCAMGPRCARGVPGNIDSLAPPVGGRGDWQCRSEKISRTYKSGPSQYSRQPQDGGFPWLWVAVKDILFWFLAMVLFAPRFTAP
jgi:hypothetical protein